MKNIFSITKLAICLILFTAIFSSHHLYAIGGGGGPTLPTTFNVLNLTAAQDDPSGEITLKWNHSESNYISYIVNVIGNNCADTIILSPNSLMLEPDGKVKAILVGYCSYATSVSVQWWDGSNRRGGAMTVGVIRASYRGINPPSTVLTGAMNIPLYIESIDGINTPNSTLQLARKTYNASATQLTVSLYQNYNAYSSNPSYASSYWNATNNMTGIINGCNYDSTLFRPTLSTVNPLNNSVHYASLRTSYQKIAISSRQAVVSLSHTRLSTDINANQKVYVVVKKGITVIDLYVVYFKKSTMAIPTDYCAFIAGNAQSAKTASLAHTEEPINLYPSLADQNISLTYTLPEAASVQVAIFNTMGEKMNHIADNMPQEAGSHEQNIDVANLPKGIYFVRFQQGEAVQTRRFVKM